uniref:Uncharacterized protein n=1 Tax=Trichuris muris TaxID=70415 RepID=A0A5S6QCQ5_TRIMR
MNSLCPWQSVLETWTQTTGHYCAYATFEPYADFTFHYRPLFFEHCRVYRRSIFSFEHFVEVLATCHHFVLVPFTAASLRHWK